MESISQSALANTSLRDRDVIEALAALVRSFETRAKSGLHYELTNLSLAHHRQGPRAVRAAHPLPLLRERQSSKAPATAAQIRAAGDAVHLQELRTHVQRAARAHRRQGPESDKPDLPAMRTAQAQVFGG